MSRKKTHEEFVAEVKALVGDEYTVVGTYVNARTAVEVSHNKCGTPYPVSPDNFLRGKRCAKCQKLGRRTPNEFRKEVAEISANEYDVLSIFTNVKTPVEMRHRVCGYKFPVQPNNFLNNKTRCPKCYGNIKSTTEIFRDLVQSHTNGEYKVLGEYVNNTTHVEIKHSTCGESYVTTPKNFKKGRRCPICQESKGERRIAKYLDFLQVKYSRQEPIRYASDKNPLKLDFYVKGVAIEYDGEYHYKPMPHAGREEGLRAQQERDAIKDKYCADNGIPLIRIPYWDFDNIDAILTEKLLPLIAERLAG